MKIKYVSQAKKRVYEFFKKKIAYPEKGLKIYGFDKKNKAIPVFLVYVGRALYRVSENGKVDKIKV